MEPVEINAGAWYLRALRDDGRVTDRPALTDLGVGDPANHVVAAQQGWADETRYTWAVCIPTTGELIAEIVVTPDGELVGRARSGHEEALVESLPVVRRFAEGALGVTLTSD